MSRTDAPKKQKQNESAGVRLDERADHNGYNRHLVFDHAVAPEGASQRSALRRWPVHCATS